jgi:hypothetical protein
MKNTVDNGVEVYKQLKSQKAGYDEKIHCPMIINILCNPNEGTMAAFCVAAKITDSTFYRWLAKYKIFNDCYRYGILMARVNWDEEGRNSRDEEGFNLEYWRIVGASRFGVGKTNRVRVSIDSDSNPYEQYKQLISQASLGDFTAGELKQLMESINVGTRTYETFELQKEIDEMRKDLLKMEQNHGNNSGAVAKT